VIHTPIANVRWWASSNMVRMSDSVDGAMVAPATPSSARAVISIGALVAYAATTDISPNTTAPISSRRRRPMRSPSEPIVISEPARVKPYTSTIHSNCVLLGCRLALSDGTARFSTVRSIAYTTQGSARTARPIHSRRVARLI
jgi:hypothetical protein